MRIAVALLLACALGCSDRPLKFPDAPDMTPLGEVSRACATASSCGLLNTSFTNCLSAWSFLTRLDAMLLTKVDAGTLTCLSNAGADCAAAANCLDGGKPQQPCSNAQQTTGGRWCDGNVSNICDDTYGILSFDCASIGLQCASRALEFPACSFGPCEKRGAQSCIDNRIAYCQPDTYLWTQITDCTAIGGTCSGDPVPLCQGRGQACTDGPPRCDGDEATSCLGGRDASLECGAARQQCVNGACVPFNDCKAPPRCDGNVLAVCGPQGKVVVDCVAFGFSGCDASNGGRCTR
jgi:hypothetical protein